MKPFKKAINQDNVSVVQVKVRVSVRRPFPSLSLNQMADFSSGFCIYRNQPVARKTSQ